MANYIVNGAAAVGGTSLTYTQTGPGSVILGGDSTSCTIAGSGNVTIASSATVGSASSDINLVTIGGSNTTLLGTGSIAIGPSALTKLYHPTNPKLYVMDSPVVTKTGTTFSSPGAISAAAVSGGMIEFSTTSGAYTMPTSSDLCTELLDTSLTSFTGAPRHTFSVTFYNTSGGVCTVATGTGQTLTNATSPISLSNGESRTWTLTFLTPSSIIIEDGSSPAVVTLSNAGTTSLVNSGTSPSLATKGLINGTGISFSTSATDVTITNAGVTSITGTLNQITATPSTGSVTISLPSAVTIASSLTISGLTPNSFLYSGAGGLLTTIVVPPTNGQLLIGSTGAAPVAANISPGTGVSITNAPGSITVAQGAAIGFSAFWTVTVNIAGGAAIAGQWSTVSPGWVNGGTFSNAAGSYTVAAGEAGKYTVTFAVEFQGNGNVIALQVNGTARICASNSNTANGATYGSCTLNLAAGDVIRLVKIGGAGNIYALSRNTAGNTYATYFSALWAGT